MPFQGDISRGPADWPNAPFAPGGGTLEATMGGSIQGMTHLRDLQGRYSRFDASMRAETRGAVAAIAAEWLKSMKEEFQPHNRTGYSEGTMKLMESGGTWATITMGGGAPYVETGTPPHMIGAKPGGPPLHFVIDGEDVFVPYPHEVEHPGYIGDPFVERAYDRIDVEGQLGAVFHRAVASNFPPEAFKATLIPAGNPEIHVK